MKTRILAVSCVLAGGWAMSASAMDQSGERYAKMLASGGPGTIARASEEIFNTAYSDQEVFDLAAQVLSDVYLKNPDAREYADATAWLCKALGSSGNARYKSLLDKVSDSNVHRKTRSHCEKAAKNLKAAAAADPFQPGSVDVSRYKDGGAAYGSGAKSAAKPGASAAPAAKAAASAGASGTTKHVDLSLVKEGMSLQEVDDILGPPTNETIYTTGKQFQPFNFGARDIQRMKYLYKGVGRIVFSMKSAYNGVYRVIEVVPDPNESGYP